MWADRASAAEQDVIDMRQSMRDYIAWLKEPTRGPVIFRSEVVERLEAILDT